MKLDQIKSIFPDESSIPPEFQLGAPIIQRQYLIDGELRHWEGALQEARSPIYLNTNDGLYSKVIGEFPLLTETESLQALDAAVRAYNSGRGIWPTMSVAQRIDHVQEFTYRMREKRTEIVNLLMWEIGKSYQDSAKEFDRTIDYIGATIDALKDLDRASSRFVIEEGIIG